MLTSSVPLRAIASLRRQEVSQETRAWPIWWEQEPEGQVISGEHYRVVVPLPHTHLTRSTDLVVISQGRVAPTDLEQAPCSGAALSALPCLTIHASTGVLAFYAHPLGRGTFFYLELDGLLAVSTRLHDLAILSSFEPDGEAVVDFLCSAGSLSTDPHKTLIAGIRQVPPGSVLVIEPQGAWHIHTYWRPQKAEGVHRLALHDAVSPLREALCRSVARAIGNATTVGIHFSGGVDSSVVAGFALAHQQTTGGKVILLAAGDEVSTRKEGILREQFARTQQAPLVEIPIDLTMNILPILREANRLAPFPTNGLFAAVNEALARQAAAEGVEVLLTGEGGDDLFGENDLLLADLLMRGKWLVAYHCLAYLTALSQNRWESLQQAGLVPLATVQPTRWSGKLARRLASFGVRQPPLRETLTPLVGATYALQADAFQQREARTLRTHVEEGWALADYQACAGIRALAPFEPDFGYQGNGALRVAAPLTDPDVFQTSLLVRLEERIRLGVGFRDKPLLRAAASSVVSPALLVQEKINVADLPWRILHHHLKEVLSVAHSPVLRRLGILPQVSEQDVIDYPDYGILRLLRLILLAIWLEEGARYVATAKTSG
jgi:hypothetical protein